MWLELPCDFALLLFLLLFLGRVAVDVKITYHVDGLLNRIVQRLGGHKLILGQSIISLVDHFVDLAAHFL